MARANAFWPTAVVGEADSVNSVSASACHIGGPKGVSPGQKALLHGIRDTYSPAFLATSVTYISGKDYKIYHILSVPVVLVTSEISGGKMWEEEPPKFAWAGVQTSTRNEHHDRGCAFTVFYVP